MAEDTNLKFCMRIDGKEYWSGKVEYAFPILKLGRLVRVHTDSHHNGHNKMTFAVTCEN